MNYEAIVSAIKMDKIEQLLYRLGAETVINKGTHLITNTICHNTDATEASHKLYYYDNSKMFMCYSNCEAMSIFKFLRIYYETRQIEYDWFVDIYEIVLECANLKSENVFIAPKPVKSLRELSEQQTKIKELTEYSSNVLEVFVKYYPPEWLQDGISKEAMDKFNILYSISQNKIIIPHRDVGGRLIGIRGRALNPWEVENIGKYMPILVEQTWYKHPLSLNLYGLYENQENINKLGVCYICESEKAVLQMESFNMPNCSVAVCGSQFNKYQLKLLLKHCRPREIIICFDKEEEKGEQKYFNKLSTLCRKYTQYCNFSFIYDRMNLLNLKDSPTDKGEDVFKNLLSHRIKIQ